MHFGNSEGRGGEGLKYGSRPWHGMDVFWNRPFLFWPLVGVKGLKLPYYYYSDVGTKRIKSCFTAENDQFALPLE